LYCVGQLLANSFTSYTHCFGEPPDEEVNKQEQLLSPPKYSDHLEGRSVTSTSTIKNCINKPMQTVGLVWHCQSLQS